MPCSSVPANGSVVASLFDILVEPESTILLIQMFRGSLRSETNIPINHDGFISDGVRLDDDQTMDTAVLQLTGITRLPCHLRCTSSPSGCVLKVFYRKAYL